MSDASDEPQDRSTAAPFVAALVIILVVLAAIFLLNRGGGDPDAEEIGRAVIAQNDAIQRQDYRAYVDYTCQSQYGGEKEFVDRQRDSVAERGERYVEGVGNVVVDGDEATAKVNYHFANDEDTTVSADLSFLREVGAWKVCAQGPR